MIFPAFSKYVIISIFEGQSVPKAPRNTHFYFSYGEFVQLLTYLSEGAVHLSMVLGMRVGLFLEKISTGMVRGATERRP